LEQYFSRDDVEEILKIQPSRRNDDDFIAWFPEKRGAFTIKSAYPLGLNHLMHEQDRGATSSRPDGERPGWKLIWECPVPPKVKFLVWKICCNAIATQSNMQRRGMVITSLCQISGVEPEDTFHTFNRCPHARSLWLAMREVWDLPADDIIKHTCKEWLLTLLHAIPLNTMTLMVLWRVWHGHNELTHDKPCPPIEGSRRFLVSYLNSLLLIKQWPEAAVEKGKMIVDTDQGFKKGKTVNDGRQKVRKRW
jgi:hypothetical protein